MPGSGACEGSTLVTEQFAVQGVDTFACIQRIAVQDDEGLAVSFGLGVDGPGCVFLAGACRSADQDHGLGVCDLPDLALHLLHGSGIADELAGGATDNVAELLELLLVDLVQGGEVLADNFLQSAF